LTTAPSGQRSRYATVMGATALWDPWDASPPTLEIVHGDQVYLVPSNFCNWLSFYRALWEHTGHPQTSKMDLMGGQRKREGQEMGETVGPYVNVYVEC